MPHREASAYFTDQHHIGKFYSLVVKYSSNNVRIHDSDPRFTVLTNDDKFLGYLISALASIEFYHREFLGLDEMLRYLKGRDIHQVFNNSFLVKTTKKQIQNVQNGIVRFYLNYFFQEVIDYFFKHYQKVMDILEAYKDKQTKILLLDPMSSNELESFSENFAKFLDYYVLGRMFRSFNVERNGVPSTSPKFCVLNAGYAHTDAIKTILIQYKKEFGFKLVDSQTNTDNCLDYSKIFTA
jgi:hypothetical protein